MRVFILVTRVIVPHYPSHHNNFRGNVYSSIRVIQNEFYCLTTNQYIYIKNHLLYYYNLELINFEINSSKIILKFLFYIGIINKSRI